MVMLGVVDTDMFEWERVRILIDWHEILGMTGWVHNIGLVNLTADLEEDT